MNFSEQTVGTFMTFKDGDDVHVSKSFVLCDEPFTTIEHSSEGRAYLYNWWSEEGFHCNISDITKFLGGTK